jgi:hypothetical protein
LATYGIVVAWYLAHGEPARDVARARRTRPWDRSKHDVAFADMLGALRLALWRERISTKVAANQPRRNLRSLLPFLETAA